jgi:hypothetical protein
MNLPNPSPKINQLKSLYECLNVLNRSDLYIHKSNITSDDERKSEWPVALVKPLKSSEYLKQDIDFIKMREASVDITLYLERTTSKVYETNNSYNPHTKTVQRDPIGQRVIIDLMKLPVLDDAKDETTQEHQYRNGIKQNPYYIRAKEFFGNYGIVYIAEFDLSFIFKQLKILLNDDRRSS